MSNVVRFRLSRCAVLLVTTLVTLGQSELAWSQEGDLGNFPKLSATNDWPWWRGPHRNGISDSPAVPVKFGETEHVAWKAAVPGRGHSSPTVVANRVYLTTADDGRQIHYLLIYDRANGALLKQVELSREGFPAKNHPKNTEATATVGSDGEHLFVSLFHHKKVEVLSLDLEGNVLWRKDAGNFNPQMYEYGYAPSPLIYDDSVIVSAEYDGDSFITALRRTDGERTWLIERPKNITFSSPVVGHVAGKDQLLISGGLLVASYDPKAGKRIWQAPGTTFATCGTMVWDGDAVFASGGYPTAETIAFKADGSRKVLWKNSQKCYEQSMLAWQGYVYALTDNGIMICWRGSDGKEMWKERLKGPVSASPVLANGNIYWANELGTMYVFRANPQKFELLAENRIGTDSFASPAICGGQIFLRVAVRDGKQRDEFLYCFSNAK